MKMLEGSRVINLVPSYSAPEQLVSAMNEIREALHQKAKERRYLQAFRQRNFEFLQRYNSLKQRVAAQLEQTRIDAALRGRPTALARPSPVRATPM